MAYRAALNVREGCARPPQTPKCVNTRFELASQTLQDKWLDEQFQTLTQIITGRILSDTAFKQALLDSAGSPLCDPDDPVYATALTSARKCVLNKNNSVGLHGSPSPRV